MLLAPGPLPAADLAAHVGRLASLLRGRRLAVLTGAGCSTESGIPDYRGPATRHRPRRPVQHLEFVRNEAVRRRYWARASLGWERFRSAQPNASHLALAALERKGLCDGLITQNVDGLHQAAGSDRVIELHGALARVRCLQCAAIEPRDALQERLLALNPAWRGAHAEAAPDGDADAAPDLIDTFCVPSCLACGGVLKPDVVFFGDNVPRPRVDASFALVDGADALLVVGSSLSVYSGLRFVTRAADRKIPVAIVNAGETRGDPFASLLIDAPAGQALPALALALGAFG